MNRSLFYQVSLVNVTGIAMTLVASFQGWVAPIFTQDQSYLTYVIAAVFVAAMAMAWSKAYTMSFSTEHPLYGLSKHDYDLCKVVLRDWLALPHDLTQKLVMLGLVGCVIGFGATLASIDPNAVSDPSAVGPMVGEMMSGMAIALNATLLGSVLFVWASVVMRMLDSGAVALLREKSVAW